MYSYSYFFCMEWEIVKNGIQLILHVGYRLSRAQQIIMCPQLVLSHTYNNIESVLVFGGTLCVSTFG